MSFQGVIGEVVEIGRGDGEMSSFEWRIPDFLSLAGEGGDHYTSPVFSACGGRWCFRLYPNGLPGISSSDCVSLLLCRLDGGPPQTLDVTLGIRGPEGVENKRERRQEFSEDDPGCFWFEFCSRSTLIEQESGLMPGNMLIVSLDMQRVVTSVAREASTQTDEHCKEAEVPTEEKQDSSTLTVEEAKEDEVPTDEKQGGEKALEDFGTLLDSGENSDVTVQVGDVEFKVHSQILFARSPALSVSLRHDSKEKASSKILIEDTEPGAFREYLQYLYTGSVRSLTEQNVFHLYRLADKYLTDDLKLLCLKHMRNTLSVRTFCDTLKLALAHGENDLLERALDFAKENIQLIIVSVEWQHFICEHPREANEILVKCFGARS